MSEALHTIKAVAQQTGLNAHVIRIWEKRYGAVTPSRTDSNRRLYSSEEVERLRLLRRATVAGHGISNIARLSNETLRELVPAEPVVSAVAAPSLQGLGRAESVGERLRPACLDAITRLDQPALEEQFEEALIGMGHQAMLQYLIAPLTVEVGELWRAGRLTVAHEHFASDAIRTFLWNASRPFAASETSPSLVVATPAGQLHELGAVIVAAAARNQGWRVIYLGTSLPAAEIAGAVRLNGARAVLLSIVYPEDDPQLPEELTQLRKYLPTETAVLVGGRAVGGYAEVIKSIGAKLIGSLGELYPALEELRRKPVAHGEPT
jgi:DNA-binding transcriptional MerR regulator/methylmalonyl-CoA mutase cobalamin-binding subunit